MSTGRALPGKPPPPLNRKYLRAVHDHQPTPENTKSKPKDCCTVALNTGDVVLVHLTNANGWADGTVLNNGHRGWFPAHYCRPYDHEFVRIFFHGLTKLWSAGAQDNSPSSWRGTRRAEVQALVQGVRHVLEQTHCLRREDNLIKTSTALYRTRKGLLSDLSALVKHADHLAAQAPMAEDVSAWNLLTNDYLQKVFKVAIRLVRFMDVWNQYNENPDAEIQPTSDDEGTASVDDTATTTRSGSHHTPMRSASSSSQASRRNSRGLSRLSFFRQSGQPVLGTGEEQEVPAKNPEEAESQAGEASVLEHPRRTSRTQSSRPVARTSKSLEELKGSDKASELLTITQTQFFENIGSFLGLHMQSRACDEINLIVLRTLGSSSTLMALIHDTRTHSPSPPQAFDESLRAFTKSLNILATSLPVPEVSRRGQPALISPASGAVLMSVATSCIRAAADCIAEARQSLQQHGDFDIDAKSLLLSARAHRQPQPALPTNRRLTEMPQSNEGHSSILVPSSLPLKSYSNEDITQDCSPASLRSETASDAGVLPARRKVSFSDEVESIEDRRTSTSSRIRLKRRSAARTLTSSSSSDIDSRRGSTLSAVSLTSTRATTPDPYLTLPKAGDRSSQLELALPWVDGRPMTDFCAAGQVFAHELMLGESGQLLGGTPRALVEHLIYLDSRPSSRLDRTFLLNFRNFMSATELASLLVSQHKLLELKEGSSVNQQERVIDILITWLSEYWDTELNASALERLQHFANNQQCNIGPGHRQRLLDSLSQIPVHDSMGSRLALPPLNKMQPMSNVLKSEAEKFGPPSEITKIQISMLTGPQAGRCSVLDFSPLELARQMTIMASKVFCRITSRELLSSALGKSAVPTCNVRAMSRLSTDMTHFVTHSIVFLDDPKKRSTTLKHWIKVGHACLTLQNYDTLMAIMCSLNSSSVLRLKNTWSQLSPKTLSLLEDLKEICEFTRNFAPLRQRMNAAKAPCLPFLGIFLTDLTFVDAGNPSTRTLPHTKDTSHPVEVINFDKYMRTASIIETVEKFQTSYTLRELPSLRDWLDSELKRTRVEDDAKKNAGATGDTYQQSLKIEPKENDSGKSLLKEMSQKPNVLIRRQRTGNEKGDMRDLDKSGLGFVRKMSRFELKRTAVR